MLDYVRVLRLHVKESIDDDSLMFCGTEFQTTGTAHLNALQPSALVVRGTCISEDERRDLKCDNWLGLAVMVGLDRCTCLLWSDQVRTGMSSIHVLTILVFNHPPTSTQPGHPSVVWVGARSSGESRRVNRYVRRYSGPVLMAMQCKLVSG